LSAPAVTVENGRARVAFERFDLDAYRLFLRCKTLPESELGCDRVAGTYTIETAERFAAILDASLQQSPAADLPLPAHLFDYQRFIVERALEARRYAVWADTGLGKTAILLEWARQVRAATGGRVLILSPLSIIDQTAEQCEQFYGGAFRLKQLFTREELARWCLAPGSDDVGICNYEKLIPGVLPELKRLAGLVLDESSILKTGGGVIKWNLIKSAKGIEHKLSCTATPAPNDTMEFASQAAFLEKLRNESEILWTYFSRDKKGIWSVKPHARDRFYEFMSSWSIYLRDPARLGFEDILSSLPEPRHSEYRLTITPEQRARMDEVLVDRGAGLFSAGLGVRERAKLAQLARGFLYEGSGKARSVARVASDKPAFVASLARAESARSPVIVWTTFDEEARIIGERLCELDSSIDAAILDGSVPAARRRSILSSFRSGELRVLITKAQLAGYGMNFQHCRSMIFSGFDDSYERMYQAVRRCYRYGQTARVHVHVPYVPELEGMIFENLSSKEARFDEDAAAMEEAYREALLA
jgi:hypothetical protein